MRDRILESYLKDFVKENGLAGLEEHEAFEHFVNYCIVTKAHSESFDFEEISIGGRGDSAIDGIAIIVNEHLVSSKEDIDFFKKTLRRLDAQFIFIQSKTSDKFDMGDIGNFLFGVRSFFDEKPPIAINSQIRHLRELKEHIYDSSIDMDRNPICHMHYVTTGRWVGDRTLMGRIEADVDALKQTDLFSEVKFIPVDSEATRKIYRELRHKVEKEIVFEKHTILPQIDNIQEAYIGILPCAEYMKLVCDDDGNLRRTLFYDNVRDYQGNNPVNREIAETIRDASQSDKFALLNNGLTIVAKSINKVGARFKLKDYQVVNGCQTTHVLYMNKEFLTQKVYLPIKLIVTNDIDTTNLIIKATNRQTEVKLEAFESLSPFQKTLEEFYATFGKHRDPRLYYERRSKQYDALPIKRNQIVSLTAQVKSFLSTFLNEPHSTHRYYGELLKAYRNRILVENHSPFPYYVSGYGLSTLERFFAEGKIQWFYKKFKYQMLMLFRIQTDKSEIPYLNSKKIDEYCSNLLSVLSNEPEALRIFEHASSVIRDTLDRTSVDPREATRLKAFTTELITQVLEDQATSYARVERERGTVIWFSDIKGYGFIESGSRDANIFVHYSSIRGSGYRYVVCGDTVEFMVIETEKGLQAEDVEILV